MQRLSLITMPILVTSILLAGCGGTDKTATTQDNLFEGDRPCTGACASAWPPVTTSSKPTVQGQAVAADLATVARANGTKQVTYPGHPLYYFIRDKDAGDAYGEGVNAFGSAWYVLTPNGQKIDRS